MGITDVLCESYDIGSVGLEQGVFGCKKGLVERPRQLVF